VLPHDACEEEKRIHKYLDDLQISMMDVKSVLENQTNKECLSPILAAKFTEINSGNSIRNTPSLL
jgi:hypothetical protein